MWDRPGQQVLWERLASQPSDWRLVDRLSSKAHRRAMNEAMGQWVFRHQLAAGGGRKAPGGTLDIDPLPIELHGNQQRRAYHGHYRKNIYYPIVASFSAEGTYESRRLGEGFVHAILRRGNAAGAEGAGRFVREAIRKARPLATHLDVRIDAGLVEGRVLDVMDDEGVSFIGRIKSNDVLERLAQPYLGRSPGRPTKEGDEFAFELGPYRAASWTRPYRLVLVVIDLPDPKTGLRELFSRSFFLVTNWDIQWRSAWDLLEHYRRRGTFEDRLGKSNAVIGPGLSAESFVANEASLLLKLLAFNLAGMIRGELEASSGNDWDLKRVQQTVLKTGARVVEHGNRIFVDVAKAAGVLWGRLLDRIKRWWRPKGVSRVGRGGHAEAGDEVWGRAKPRPRAWVSPPSHAHLCLVLRE